jgi:hypothetical protein
MNKVCSTCKQSKPLSEFGIDKNRKHGIRSNCKLCKAKADNVWKQNNPNKWKTSHMKWDWWKSYLNKKYNLTKEQYDKMVENQNNKCAICDVDFNSKWTKNDTKFKTSACVDHCHKTGKIRGLLCNQCNLALGRFKDDSTLLQRAIDYLK